MVEEHTSETVESSNEHPCANLDVIVVDTDDVIQMIRRNGRDERRQRTNVIRVSPPFDGIQEGFPEVTQRHSRYPPEMSPKPIHLLASHIFTGRPGRQLDAELRFPRRSREKTMFRDEFEAYGEDNYPRELTESEEEQWEKWWETAVSHWEDRVRYRMQESTEIILGNIPNQSETTVEIRFE